MQTRKTRHQFYLPDHLLARLDALATQPGSKTAVLSDALLAWFERREAADTDAQFGKVLEKQVSAVERIEKQVDHLTKLLGRCVRFHLTQTAHHPVFDNETNQLGQSGTGSLLGSWRRRQRGQCAHRRQNRFSSTRRACDG